MAKPTLNLQSMEEEKIEAFSKGSQLAERGNTAKGGRPKVEDAEKVNKGMSVYFTAEERETVNTYCKHISFSSLVKQKKKKKGIL